MNNQTSYTNTSNSHKVLIMKKTWTALVLSAALSTALLGCAPISSQTTAHADYPPLGSDAWYAWVDKAAGVSDGQGHGPDYATAEWCNAANWRVFGKRNDDGKDCSPEWQAAISKALRESGR